MKKLIKISLFLFGAALLQNSYAEGPKKEMLNTVGLISKAEKDEGLTFMTAEGKTYYVWTKEVIAKLKLHLGKKIKIKGTAKPTKDGKRQHIVWVSSVEVVQ
jgi:hypothetical protein